MERGRKEAGKTSLSSHPVACICMHTDGDAKLQLTSNSVICSKEKKKKKFGGKGGVPEICWPILKKVWGGAAISGAHPETLAHE